jgi:hypothetical protein
MSGIVYLIQPEILLGTNKYKIGCSSKNNMNRINSYGKNTRKIYIEECINPFEIEKIIKNMFKNKFKLICGNEWFEGDENDIVKEFKNILSIYKKDNDQNFIINNNILKEKIDELPLLNNLASSISNDPKLIEISLDLLCKKKFYLFCSKEIIKYLIINKETSIAIGRVLENGNIKYINDKINIIISKYMINRELINNIMINQTIYDDEELDKISNKVRFELFKSLSYFFTINEKKGKLLKLFDKMINDITNIVLNEVS